MGFRLWVSDFGLRISGCEFEVSNFGFQVSGFGFRVSCSGLRLRVRLRDGFRASGSGFGVQALDQDLNSTRVLNLEEVMGRGSIGGQRLGC